MQMTIFNINFPKCIFLLSLRMSQISQDLLPKRVVLQVRYIRKNTIDVFIGIQYIANGYNSQFLLEMGAHLLLQSCSRVVHHMYLLVKLAICMTTCGHDCTSFTYLQFEYLLLAWTPRQSLMHIFF